MPDKKSPPNDDGSLFREGDRLITLRQVLALTAHGKSWVYEQIAAKRFPPGEKIGRRRYWIERVVVEAIRRLLDSNK